MDASPSTMMSERPHVTDVAIEQPADGRAPSAGADRWKIVRISAPFVLAALSVVLLRRELPDAGRALRHARPVALLALPLFLVWNHLATLAWRALLRASGAAALPFRALVRLRIEAQAVNQIVPAAGMAGEGMRAVRAAAPGDLGATSLATVLDNVAGTMSGLVFAAGALGLHLSARAGRTELGTLMATTVGALVLLGVITLLPFQLGHRFVPRLSREGWARRLLAPFADRRLEMRRAFGEAVALRFLERIVSAGEVFVAFAAVGAPLSPSDAALVSAVFIVVSYTVFFLPGQLGAAEAAVTTVSVLLGVPAALGLSAALLRRARQLAVCAIGVVSIALRRRHVAPTSAVVSRGETP